MRRWPASLSWPVAAAAPSALDEVTVSTSIPLGARSTNTMGVPRSISEKRWLWFLLRSVSTILRHLPSEFSVAPPRFRQFRRSWSSVHKALRVRGVCLEEHDLLEAYASHPERFVNAAPRPPELPEARWCYTEFRR